jgi:hypothetical protein
MISVILRLKFVRKTFSAEMECHKSNAWPQARDRRFGTPVIVVDQGSPNTVDPLRKFTNGDPNLAANAAHGELLQVKVDLHEIGFFSHIRQNTRR